MGAFEHPSPLEQERLKVNSTDLPRRQDCSACFQKEDFKNIVNSLSLKISISEFKFLLWNNVL